MMPTMCWNTFGVALAVLVAVCGMDCAGAFVHGTIGSSQEYMGQRMNSIGAHMTSAGDDTGGTAAVGPKAQGRTRSSRSTGPRSTGPRSPRPARRTRPEASNPSSTPEPKAVKEPFDGKVFAGRQTPNAQAPRFDLRAALTSESPSGFRCVTPGVQCLEKTEETDVERLESPFEYRSLDDLLAFVAEAKGMSLPDFSLSKTFNADKAFRTELRSAIRLDVFETTPYYANLPDKAKTVLLLPDSSLEGSWRIPDANDDNNDEMRVRRMKHTTRVLNQVLKEHLGEENESFCFTGDDLFEAIGAICGDGASTHWIDIYGVQDRKINHSWHLDAGRSPMNCRTVLWGFPPEDEYTGTGVFSHIVSLEDPFGSTIDIQDDAAERSRMEPVLFEGTPGEDYVFRPLYEPGKELLIYRDIDVLHSAPDVAYRTSVMRFM